MKKALIVVDVQYDFCAGGALAVPRADEAFVATVATLTEKFDLVVATQDWHPLKHGSFADIAGVPLYSQFTLDGLPQTAWPQHCVQGTLGSELRRDLGTKPAVVFRKGMDPKVDSYSGFADNAGRNDTGLEAYLKGRGVTDVYLCGLALDYCVKFTALDAIARGFTTHVVVDATRAVNVNPEDGAKATNEVFERGGRIRFTTDAF